VSAPTQYGSRFNALLVYLNQQQLLPAARTVQLMQDIFGQKVSQGTLFRAINACHGRLSGFEQRIKDQLRKADVLHADESGLRTAGSLHWLHVTSTEYLTFYGVHKKRGRIAMDEFNILPGFNGRLIHDFWKPYLAYDCLHGLCNTHHLRELLFLFEEQKQTWAGQMIEALLDMHHFTLSRKENPVIQLTEEKKHPGLRAIVPSLTRDGRQTPCRHPHQSQDPKSVGALPRQRRKTCWLVLTGTKPPYSPSSMI